MIAILAGSIGRFPVGGHAWVDMQYLLGLRALGHDVYYIEECGAESWVYNWHTERLTTDLEYPTSYLDNCLRPIGFGDRWAYRAGGACVGMSVDDVKALCGRADLLLIRGGALELWRPEYDRPRVRAFIDADPAFTQFSIAGGKTSLVQTIAKSERLFTIAQRMGRESCTVPALGREWIPTVAPIALQYWPDMGATGDDGSFTAVMQWRSYPDVTYEGETYGNKDREFPAYLDLPVRTRQRFKIALTAGGDQELRSHGWEVVAGWQVSYTPGEYQRFIRNSLAEFGVAKHGYVKTRAGWFSDRSVCYLACGRPVLVQDTGLSDWLPVGEGLLTFTDLDSAVEGVYAINTRYAAHTRAARDIAKNYFSASLVLARLVEQALS